MMADFWILLSNTFYGFSGFAKEVTPWIPAKTQFRRRASVKEKTMPSRPDKTRAASFLNCNSKGLLI